MAVIKATQRLQSIPFNFEDLSRQAGTYLADVQRQAREIIQQAQNEAAAIRAAAEAEGKKAAELDFARRLQQHADEITRKQLQTLLPAIQQAVGALRFARQEWLCRWEEQAVKLSAAMAARVIRRELKADPEIPLNLIQESLRLACGNPRLRIRLHPQDHAALGQQARLLAQQLAPLAETEIVADDAVSLGGCLLQTDHGSIDQRFETQLARIQEELL
jgi:flagellar assembly protein FliH